MPHLPQPLGRESCFGVQRGFKLQASHVGIYVGEGKFIHAPRSGQKVRVEDMREAYRAKRLAGARRADLNAADNGGAASSLN